MGKCHCFVKIYFHTLIWLKNQYPSIFFISKNKEYKFPADWSLDLILLFELLANIYNLDQTRGQ